MLQYLIQDLSNFTECELRRSFSCMSDARREKVLRVRNETAKKSTLAGEYLARRLLSDTTGLAFESFLIAEDENGKPIAKNANGLFFNITHSGSKIAAVVSDRAVGIDLEIIRNISLKPANKVCTADELVYVFGKMPSDADFSVPPSEACIRRFLEIWTVKEAYFKCIGTGITDFLKIHAFSEDFCKTKVETEEYIMHLVTLK